MKVIDLLHYRLTGNLVDFRVRLRIEEAELQLRQQIEAAERASIPTLQDYESMMKSAFFQTYDPT